MKLLGVLVSLIATLVANGRNLLDVGPEYSALQDTALLDTGDHELQEEPQGVNKENGQEETEHKKSKCKADISCIILGGGCVTKASLCKGRLVEQGCKGKSCQCCIPIDGMKIAIHNLTRELKSMKEDIKNLKDASSLAFLDLKNTSSLAYVELKNLENDSSLVSSKLDTIQKANSDTSSKLNDIRKRQGCTIIGRGRQCFTIHHDLMNWHSAVAACKSNGGRLAKLGDPWGIGAYVVQRYGQGKRQFWVGGSDITTEGKWTWLTGEQFASNFPWGSGQPDNYHGNEDCLQMNWSDKGYNDAPCSAGLGYICEYP